MNPLLFTDPSFLFFFAPIVLSGYWILPARLRNGFLLAGSLLLYAWGEGRYTGVLIASITINLAAGAAIQRAGSRHIALAAGVGLNLALLTVFKYSTFVILNLDLALAQLGIPRIEPPGLHLPIGLSFYTFIGISYLVDLYRRDLATPSSPTQLSLFMAMFPHLVAGPIVRMTEIGPQFGPSVANAEQIASGIRRFIIGLGKKMLIANTIATVPDAVFELPVQQIPAGSAWFALGCYTLQIYYDFSGYSDMAIGLARILGFEFPENFNYPYVSQSVTEFWRRWHMTLSQWLRDYLFFPLGGATRLVRNQLIVFLLCGLWHGADWHFVAWGLWHGALVAVEQLGFNKVLSRAPAPIRIAYMLGAVALGWVLFRSISLHYAFGFVQALAGFGGTPPVEWLGAHLNGLALYVAIAAGVLGAVPLKRPRCIALEYAALACVFILSLAAIASDTYNPFIYFRF